MPSQDIAKVAAARKLLTLVFYGLHDGRIRCMPDAPVIRPAPQPRVRAAWPGTWAAGRQAPSPCAQNERQCAPRFSR
jgi:hypothetical protein